MVPEPFAVKVTEEAPPPEPMLAARAILPLELAPVSWSTTAPVALSNPLTVIVGEEVLLSVSV
jgi:hypothetical protein